VPFFWHVSGIALGMVIIANERKVEIKFLQFSGNSKPAEASGSISVSEPGAR
jgi:hypothetical protein